MNNQNNTPSSSVDVKSSNGKTSTTSTTEKKKPVRHNRNTLKKKSITSSPPSSSLNGSTYSQGASANMGTSSTANTITTAPTSSSTMTFSAQQVSSSSSPPTPSKVIFFRRIPADTTQSDLKSLCQPFGAVTNILLLKNGQALVQFAYLDEAIDFIEAYNQDPPSFVIRDTRVIPSYSSHNELSKGSISKSDSNSNQATNNGKQQEPNHILLVTISKSKASDVTIDALYELFSVDDSCPIQKIVMFNKTAGLQALIQYSNVNDAIEARKQLQGTSPFSPQDQLLIQFSNLKDLTVHQNSDKARDYTKQSSNSTSTPPSVATSSASSPPTTNIITATTSTPSIMKRAVPSTGNTTINTNNKPSTTPTTTTTSTTINSPPSQPITQPLQQDPRSRSNSASSGVFEHHQVIQPQHGIPQTTSSPTITSFMNNIPSTTINTSSNVPNTNASNRVPIAHLHDANNANLMSASFFSYAPFSHRDSFGAFSSNIPSSQHQHSHHHHLSHPSSGHNTSSSSSHHHTHNHHQTNSVQNQFLNPSFLASHQQTTHPLGHHQPFTTDNLIMPTNGVMVLPQNGSQTSNTAPNSATQYHLLNNSFGHMRANPSTPSNSNPKNPNNTINGIISAPSSSLLPTDNNAGALRLNVNIPSSSSNPSNTPSATLGTIGSNIPSSRLLSTPNTQTNTHSPTEEKEDITEQEDEEVIDENDLESKDPNSEKSSVLLVSNFNDKIMNCDLLFNLFSCYGYIYRIKIFKTKPDHALVQMASHKQALNAINSLKGLQIFGKTLSVNFSKHTFINSSKSDNNMKDYTKTNLNRFPRNLSISPSSNSPTAGKQHKLYMCQPTQTLHISNVPFEKDDKGREILTTIFSKFGEIEGLRVFRHNDKPMALIKFKTVTAAAEALASLHNDTISGKHMKVAFSLNTVVNQTNKKQ
ncbi:hypothetical protein C9374_008440 [Naegleria lovaniensis]|uniref:RRM domain-containing protein n=1 Tax=Naegleria lovaniensis TaxID=51637 RepID=A0AA88KFH0_NAELO|nr:uncharacterized protein C9374_008440 [Naegleria lovaniensis]KAG2378297.1 hypothetical protein C9374_008440 [Naegleria lovaniensis]